jgi:hypothetical protein
MIGKFLIQRQPAPGKLIPKAFKGAKVVRTVRQYNIADFRD